MTKERVIRRKYQRTSKARHDYLLGVYPGATKGPTDVEILGDMGAQDGDDITWTITVEIKGQRAVDPPHRGTRVLANTLEGAPQQQAVFEVLRQAGRNAVLAMPAVLEGLKKAKRPGARDIGNVRAAAILAILQTKGLVTIPRRGAYKIARGWADGIEGSGSSG